MFFEEEPINENLQCPICRKRFQDPVLLPCEECVCQQCINDYIEEHSEKDQTQFKCLFCDEEHVIPANGFQKSKLINRLLELKPKKVNRGPAIEKLNENVNKCLNMINEIKQFLENRENIVKDTFELKRQQIQIDADSRIEEINKRTREKLDHVDQLENEHLESLREQTQQQEIETQLKKAEDLCSQLVDKIKSPETTENDATNEHQNLHSIHKLILLAHLKAKRYIFSFIEGQDDKIKSPESTDDDATNERKNLESIRKLIHNFRLKVNRYVSSTKDDDVSEFKIKNF